MFPTTLRIALVSLFTIATLATVAQAQVAVDPVLVKGSTLEVRKSEFETEKRNVPPDQRVDLSTNLPRIQRTLERLFLNKILVAEAQKNGFAKDPTVVAELDYLVSQKLASMYANKLSADIKMPDLEPALKEQYKLESASLAEPEKVRVSHILVSLKKRSREEALRRAEEVRAKAVAGADFKALVKEFSDDPTALRNDGDLGFFPFGQMVPEFAKASFAMTKPGEISQVVESDFGLHIIRYTDRMAPRTPTYEELRSKFLEEKEREYRSQQMRETFNRMMEANDPKANMDEVQKLLTNPTAEAARDWSEKIRKEIQGQQPKRP